MKRIIALFLLLGMNVGLVCGCQQKEAGTEPTTEPPQVPTIEIGDPILTTFTTMDMDKNPVDQQILSGHKLTMINVWGTFCDPCIREMPDLGELSSAYGDDFQILGIVIDATDRNLQTLPEKIAKAKEIISTTHADYLHVLPSASLNKAFLSEVSSVPTTIFVDENGNQIGQSYLGAKTKEQWQEIIEPLLKQL